MFEELSRIMDFAANSDDYLLALEKNIIDKGTFSNRNRTISGLLRLYGFDTKDIGFRCFKYFWSIVEDDEKPILAILFAVKRDFLLSESITVVVSTAIGEKVEIWKLQEQISVNHPNLYTAKTILSAAQNIASSWKQAGYIIGKVKNIRVKIDPGYSLVAFAILMSYLEGFRGDFLVRSKWALILDLSEMEIRDQAFEAAKRDLLQYQYAGGVTTISFRKLFEKLGFNDN
jgi:hypothetical protein